MGVRYVENDKTEDEIFKQGNESIEEAIHQWFKNKKQEKHTLNITALRDFSKDPISFKIIGTTINNTPDDVSILELMNNTPDDVSILELMNNGRNIPCAQDIMVNNSDNIPIMQDTMVNSDDNILITQDIMVNNSDNIPIMQDTMVNSDDNQPITQDTTVNSDEYNIGNEIITNTDIKNEENKNAETTNSENLLSTNTDQSSINVLELLGNKNEGINDQVMSIINEQKEVEKRNKDVNHMFHKAQVERLFEVYDIDDKFLKAAYKLMGWYKPVMYYLTVYQLKYNSVDYLNRKAHVMAKIRGVISNQYRFQSDQLSDINKCINVSICEMALTIITLMGANETINPFTHQKLKLNINDETISYLRELDSRAITETAFKESTNMTLTYHEKEQYDKLISNIFKMAFGWKYSKDTITSPYIVIFHNGKNKMLPLVGKFKFTDDPNETYYDVEAFRTTQSQITSQQQIFRKRLTLDIRKL
jgi:hypothetical protein